MIACLNNLWLKWNELKKEEISVYLKGNDVCVGACGAAGAPI